MSTKAKLTPFGDAVAGAGGALLALAAVYPLDIIKTRMQVQSKSEESYTSTWDAFVRILKEEGVGGLYAGLPAGLIGVASTNFAYFYWYSLLRGSYSRKVQEISTSMELVLGAGAAALAQIFTIPVSVVSTRQQTTPPSERGSLWQTWLDIVEEEGWTGLWKGLKPSLVLVVNPAITYGAFEKIKSGFLARSGGKALSALEVFLVGALAKTAATLITYPYIMAKVRLQWKPPKNADTSKHHERYNGAIDVLKKVWKKDGLKGLYNGMDAQIYKAVLSQALLLMLKEKLSIYTLLMFALFNKRKLKV
ncbi:hypothetical protein K7432_015093 [Basidiobolus ranarum]|uniref:Uncharacterized protein n=1 Tax=Basidiobolus ranarum TaxID=34480 RepID=A0ABR2WGS4_9FUNG